MAGEKAAAREMTPAELLDAVCGAYGVTHERKRDDGGVLVRLTNRDGERVAGRGKTTAEAVANAAKRAEEVWGAR